MGLAGQSGPNRDTFMFKRSDSIHGLVAGTLSMLLLIAACDSGDSGGSAVSSTGQQAAADNASRPAGDTTDASKRAQIAPRRAVDSERLPYGEVDDELANGYFVFPVDMIEPLPAVIVIHEWWGLNDNVRAMADRLAGEGYIVLAIDLYGGEVADSVNAARRLMREVVEDPDPAAENIRQAYKFLESIAGAPRIGSLGWDLGGGWSLNAALLFPDELDAAVIYYGQITDDEELLQPMNVPILGLFGAADRGISVASIQVFEAALERLRKNYEIHIYPDARHAFADTTGNTYNAEAAEDAWEKTLDFFSRNLAGSAATDN